MKEIIEIFSSRELAMIMWLLVLIGIAMRSKDTRLAFLGILKIFFNWMIQTALLILVAYVVLLLAIFYKIGWWNIAMLKDTIIWFIGSGAILMFSMNKAKDISFFKTLIVNNLKFIILLEFLINLYTFHFIWELIILPFFTLLLLLQYVAEGKKEHAVTTQVLKKVTVFFGTLLLLYVAYKTISGFNAVVTYQNALLLLLPPVLTILIIPYLYGIALYMSYESLLVRLKYLLNYQDQWPEARKLIFKVANVRLGRVNAINKGFSKFYYYHSADRREYLKGLANKTFIPPVIT